MLMHKRYSIFIFFSLFIFISICCNKTVQISEPVNTITTSEVFRTEANANSAIAGIYNDMSWRNGGYAYADGAITINASMSSDDLNGFYNSPFQFNTLLPDNGNISSYFWTPMFYDIYLTNAAIEGLQASTSLAGSFKKPLIGEAKFLRAYINFNLINLFGDVPLVTTTAWANTDTLHRTASAIVYRQVINDLKDAQSVLPSDYAVSGQERIRANKWAATALLSRTYLYTSTWDSAEMEASSIINNENLFGLVSNLDSAFLSNNTEAIWQLQLANLSPYATREGQFFIPTRRTTNPNYYLTKQLLAAFEPLDKRRVSWVDSSSLAGKYYLYPKKYKIRVGTQNNILEYYTLFRLAEQYLIRAEARAHRQKLSDAIADLNIIRKRAGLNELPNTLNQSEVLAAVAQERRIEFFCEEGHRWFDLKRTGQADAVLSFIKPQWKSTAQLYPVPLAEIQNNPNLKQNPGYQ